MNEKEKKTETLETFIVGNSNRDAVRAAGQFLANEENCRFLVLCGPTGTGKTHLAMAIGNKLFAENDVRMRNSETFLSELIGWLIQKLPLESFCDNYAQADVCILEDIQWLEGKGTTCEFVMELLDRLLAGGKRVLLTTDRPVEELPWFHCSSPFRQVKLSVPDLELRRAILMKWVEKSDLSKYGELLSILAENVENIRMMKGIYLRKLAQYECERSGNFAKELEQLEEIKDPAEPMAHWDNIIFPGIRNIDLKKRR